MIAGRDEAQILWTVSAGYFKIPEEMTDCFPGNLRACLGGAALAVVVLSAAGGEMRTWTSIEGQSLRASLLSAEGDSVLLQLDSGREAKVPLTRLSEADRRFVEHRRRTGRALVLSAMPEESSIPREIEVEGGPGVFRTEHFEFETDEKVSSAFISEAARVFEGTYQALDSLPHGLTFAPPGDRSHFRGRFMSDRAFFSFAADRVPEIRGQRVVGLYLGKEKELLVPYSSLGAKQLGSRMTLRKSSDTTTLIHEIVHQVMDTWLPVIPTWFSEGMAEYLAAVPYQNGRFEFRNAERGLRERLAERYGIREGHIGQVIPPSTYFEVLKRSAGEPEWGGTVREYRDALLTIYYFMHLADPEEAGVPVGAYLRFVDAALDDVDQVRQDLAAFEKKRLDYNEQVQEFNAALRKFREEAAAYNERVVQYNEQVRSGVPGPDRIEVGERPAEPVPPKQIVVPGSLESAAATGGAIDLVVLVQEKALPALLQGGESSELDRRMKEAFAEIGFEIGYGP